MSNNNPNSKKDSNFKLKATAEFLDGKHHFYIPSYQRGYRWGKTQIQDLLKDIADFASNSVKGQFYCLQPVVVQPRKWQINEDKEILGWEVIDGQQRLTTLLLLLLHLRENSEDGKNSPAQFYDIHYETRPALDFKEPNPKLDIDSYHVFMCKKIIENWFNTNKIKKSKMVEVLFDDYPNENDSEKRKQEPQVKFIWYVTENNQDIDSIKTFNNLNKGKISLTNAELIKALFVLRAQKEDSIEKLNLNELLLEWNEIEKSLQDNRFWYFISNINFKPATRIDILFDLLTNKKNSDDDDFSYRKFQDLFDESGDFWNEKQINNFTTAWKEFKLIYYTLKYWYEESTLYHYIGFLIYYGEDLSKILENCRNKTKPEIEKKLKQKVSNKLKIRDDYEIEDLSYSDNKEDCKKILIFFNIQTSLKQHKKLNEKGKINEDLTYYKFPFDLLKLNNWDIEHVGSQKKNLLKKNKDKIIWLGYIKELTTNDEKWPVIQNRARKLKEDLKENKVVKTDSFEKIYEDVYNIFQSQDEITDTLDNLTLLDAGTNRGYGNALFPSKRLEIIKKDKNGAFIPPCTKNLFLKYYSQDDNSTSQWKNTWGDNDRKMYLKSLKKSISELNIT